VNPKAHCFIYVPELLASSLHWTFIYKQYLRLSTALFLSCCSDNRLFTWHEN